MEVEFD